jgi:hypothetical protein
MEAARAERVLPHRRLREGMRAWKELWRLLAVCRHIAWLGPPRRLSELSLEPEHGLIVQSYAPRGQAHGRVNAGGWGAGFFTAGRPEPTERGKEAA